MKVKFTKILILPYIMHVLMAQWKINVHVRSQLLDQYQVKACARVSSFLKVDQRTTIGEVKLRVKQPGFVGTVSRSSINVINKI